MKTIIFGMGGVGGFFGGMLAKTYAGQTNHEVHFIARGAHLEQINRLGLKLKYNQEEFIIHPTSAGSDVSGLPTADLVLVTTKSYDLSGILSSIQKVSDENTVILPLQNGLENSDVLGSAHLPGILCEGLVYVGSEIESPGVIKTIGAAQKLIFGIEGKTNDRLKLIEKYLSGAGFQVVLTESPLKYKWMKFQFIGALSAVTARHRKTVGEVLGDSQLRNDYLTIMDEISKVAKAKGIDFPDNAAQKSLEIAERMGYEQTTSFQRDYAAGKNNELEAYLGKLITEANLTKVSVPVSEKYYLELKNK